MKTLLLVGGAVLCAVLFAQTVSGQVSQKKVVAAPKVRYLEYEGVLSSSLDASISGYHAMTFRIYGSATVESHLWEETHRVDVRNGEFNTVLGKKSPLPSSDEGSYYIGITIDGDELSPRQPITTAGVGDDIARGSFAAPAVSTQDPEGPPVRTPFGGGGGGWTDDGTVVRLDTASDSVAIGSTTPSARLYVEGSGSGSTIKAINNNGGIALRGGSYASSGSPNHGVWGLGSNTGSGETYGGYFSTAPSGTGANYGLSASGYSASTSPVYGIYGYAQNSASDSAYGGFFRVDSSGTGHHLGLYVENKDDDAYPNWTTGAYSYAQNSNTGYTVGFLGTAGGWGDPSGGHVGVQGQGFNESSSWATGVFGYGQNFGLGNAVGGYFQGEAGDGNSMALMSDAGGWTDSTTYGVKSFASNLGPGDAYGGYFSVSSSGSGIHYGVYAVENPGGNGAAVYAAGDQIASGTKSAVVKTASSGHRLFYSQESPEVWFEDFGEGQLTSGRARVQLDPLFLESVTIDDAHPMKVFVQLTSGEPLPVVVERGRASFGVRVGDRESVATFTYRVVAKRRGYEDERLSETDSGHEDPNLYPELNEKNEQSRVRAREQYGIRSLR